MLILGISCSPKKQGNTVLLMEEALAGARQEGAETELFSVAGKDIRHCDGCGACNKTGECHIKDDVQALYPKMVAADGIIYGTPVYSYGMTGLCKTIIERSQVFNYPEKSMANKVGGIIVTAGSLGVIEPIKYLYFYFITRQMIPANYVGAYAVGDLRKMEKCMKGSRDLGRQMVQIAAQKFQYPKEFPRVGVAYGTHTR
jgi:multimeric flavodoxin WrbA